ncbi:MAG: beta-ketoacyl-ACP synthase III [Saprospiraceae bacterium]
MARLAAITGVHGFLPDYVLTNKELETMVDTNDQWITERTGIKERRILKDPEKATSDLGVGAVKGLLEKTNTSPDEIDLLICATVTADFNFPDTANIICDKVGINHAYGFDVNAACSGFLFALNTASKFIETGFHKKVIVVGAEKMSSIIDYTDRSTCIIFGDGAGAVLLEANEEGNGIQDAILRGDGAGREFLFQKAGGSLNPATAETVLAKEHVVYQNGRPVFKAAVQGMADVVKKVMARNNLDNESLEWLVPHQANIRIIESVANMTDFPMEKVMVNIQKYGNTTAATLPLCLWDYESQLKKGDDIILTAFGGGFTWGAVYLKWAYDGK